MNCGESAVLKSISQGCIEDSKETKYFIHRVIQCMSEGFFQDYAYRENAEYIILARGKQF